MVYFESLLVGTLSLIVGIIIALILVRKTNILEMISKEERYKNEVINNPELLLQKLNENGPFVDEGEELHFSITKKEGKSNISVNRVKLDKKKKKQ